MLTAARLREVLSYDPITGIWIWQVQLSHRGPKGSRAGSDNSHGYWCIQIDRKRYRVSRLAWLYMTGEWPENEVDHKNGVSNDDRWSNLREATRCQNNSNRERSCANTSGFKGVSWDKAKQKWHAYIKTGRRQKHLGFFDNPMDASAAYCDAAQREHGAFARVAAAERTRQIK